MKKVLKSYLANFKNILILLLISNLVFLVIYNFLIYPIVIRVINTKEDIVDKIYYNGIFNNLEFGITITIIMIIVIVINYEKVKIYFVDVLSNKNILIYCILGSITIQLLLLLFITPQPISDSKYYLDHAKLLFESGSYISDSGNFTAFWPVGLPAYLAFLMSLSKDFILISKLINILISSGLILICYYIFKNYLSVFGLNVFLLIFTFFPNNLFSSNIILTDYPFTLFLWGSLLAIFVFQKNPSIWLAILIGILCGIVSYLRPIGIILPLVYAMVLFLRKIPAWKMYSLIIIVTFLITILPWSVRNINIFHSFVPISTNGGYIFLMGNHENSNGGVNFDFEYDITNPNEAIESTKAYKKATDDILNYPIESIIRIPQKIIQTYYRGDSSITWGFKQVKEDVPPLLISIVFYITNLSFYLLVLLNIIAIFLFRDRIKFNKYLELILISISMVLILVFFVGTERYHIPLLPIHIFLAAKYFEK